MPTHDYVIDNQTAPNFRADLNQALQAIVSNNSSTSAPTTTYANMMWYDTTNNLLRMRNEADDAWITLGTLDQASNTFQVAGITSAAIIAGLGYTPVQQGGGASQGSNKVYIGWDGGGLRVQVDSTDLGRVAFGSVSTDAGAIGTYCFARSTTASDVAFGSTRAGSALIPTSAEAFGQSLSSDYIFGSSSALSGTWRCMGYYDYSAPGSQDSGPHYGATLWLRIS